MPACIRERITYKPRKGMHTVVMLVNPGIMKPMEHMLNTRYRTCAVQTLVYVACFHFGWLQRPRANMRLYIKFTIICMAHLTCRRRVTLTRWIHVWCRIVSWLDPLAETRSSIIIRCAHPAGVVRLSLERISPTHTRTNNPLIREHSMSQIKSLPPTSSSTATRLHLRANTSDVMMYCTYCFGIP